MSHILNHMLLQLFCFTLATRLIEEWNALWLEYETVTVLSDLLWYLWVGYSTFFKYTKKSYLCILTPLNHVQ
jgi:energy-converting hydrogenase Eha subunit G